MKKWLCFLLILTTFVSAASDISTLYRQGGKAYAEKNYDKAIQLYQQAVSKLEAKGEKSFDLLYNLGCANFRKGDLASARLYFEQAKRIRPLDFSVNRNLKILKSRLTDKIKTPATGMLEKTYRHIYQSIPYPLLTGLLLFFWALVFIFTSLLISGRFPKKPLYYGLGISIVLLLLTFGLTNSRAGELSRREAVVFQPEVEVFSEPTTASSLLFRIHPGTLVHIEGEDSGYIHIALPDGMNGWARKQSFKTIQ
ncbi:MAG: tetratricopeptide repeat protein [Acidobacteria bacterium]|nr:tetratricopeptide repeat protein [Acidobacteriota bacterium]